MILVGPDAALLHFSAVLYLWEMELPDGVVPEESIRGLCPLVRQTNRAIERLTTKALPGESPLWRRVRGGYFVVDWEWWETRIKSALRSRIGNTRRQRRLRERRRVDGDDQKTIEFPGSG